MNSSPVPGNYTIPIEPVYYELSGKHSATVSVLRLDTIHPVVSGNKLFKLHFFLKDAHGSSHKQVITFGGAYSNHLAATAFACYERGLSCVGIVRGERPAVLSPTLSLCIRYGMTLEFISRASYKNIGHTGFLASLTKKYGAHTLIPEGGYAEKGVEGAKLIMRHFDPNNFTHICCAVGTATTFAAVIAGCPPGPKVTGFNVLKNISDLDERLQHLKVKARHEHSCNGNYHFGGYAKKTTELVNFMNIFYQHTKIPLDFVYTGKMMFGVYDLLSKHYFPEESKILCIHTGGLQGNTSLPAGTLIF